MNEILSDFPKLHCPFIRQTFPLDGELFKKNGRRLGLRAPEVYLVVNRVNPGYEWVFEDSETFAVEKLNGTNVKIKMEKGRLIAFQNRKNVIDPMQLIGGGTKMFIFEGLLNVLDKGYVPMDGEQAGELVGPKVNANPYRLDHHEWVPFDKTVTSLRYKSFDEHARTFDNWSAWFKDHLLSRYALKKKPRGMDTEADKIFAEGVVFYNLKRKAEGLVWMAKLRRDMFDWYYSDLGLQGYESQGRPGLEDPDSFE